MDKRRLFDDNNFYGGASAPPAVAPTITSSDTFNAAENQTAVGTVTATGTAPITFSITGGADQALFAIDSGTGVLTFLVAPDFEDPQDAGANNVYNLTVTATNAGGATNQNVAVTVTDVAEPPIVSPAAWHRFNTGITVTGAGVSQWDDASGNGRHLLQATDARRPAKQAGGEITFNGTSHLLKTTDGAYAISQPFTIYMLFKQITWEANDVFFNVAGAGAAATMLRQIGTTPSMYLYAGTGNAANNTTLALNTYGAVAAVYNGASSAIHVNGQTATTGNPGTNGMTRLALGADATPFNWANIEVKEIQIYAAAHDATQRQTVFDYLAGL